MGNQSSTVSTYPLIQEAPLKSTSLPLPQLSTSSVDYGAPLESAYGLQLSNLLPQLQTGNPSTAFLDNALLTKSFPNELKVGQGNPPAGTLDML